MKIVLFLLALIAISNGAAVSRKNFQDNFEDFLDIIVSEVGEELMSLGLEYHEQDEEYQQAMQYLQGSNFVNILSEMEHLEEFAAMTDYLENDNIHIYYYLDIIHQALGIDVSKSRSITNRRSGTGFNGMLREMIDILPKEKLAALFDQKMAEDEEFKETMSNLQSEEFNDIWVALWENEVFQAEVNTLDANGISVQLIVEEIMALFGQN